MAVQKNRILWIDVTKAIAIILVIAGHTLTGPLNWIIFSFHMFLFFFLSAWTSKFAEDKAQLLRNIKKGAKHLLLPAVTAFLLVSVYQMVLLIIRHASLQKLQEFWIGKALCLLFSSGKRVFLGIDVPGFSVLWFLVALFFGKVVYDCLHLLLFKHRIVLLICTAALSVFGVFIGTKQHLFFSFDIALAVQIIFFLAQYFREFYHPEEHPVRKTIITFSVWAVTFTLPRILIQGDYPLIMTFASRSYPLFPLCYICALSGTLFFCQIGYFISTIKWKKGVDAICYLGANSLYMLLIHYFDAFFPFLYSFSDNMYIQCAVRIVIDVIAFAVFMWVREKVLKRISKKRRSKA